MSKKRTGARQKTTVDLEVNTVLIGDRKYWWEENDYDEEIVWHTLSRKFGETEDEERVKVDDESEFYEYDLNRVEVRVRNPKKLKRLNQLLKEARRKARANVKRPDPTETSDDEGESISDEGRDDDNGKKQGVGLSVRIKSAVSSFSLMIRALPSKKHSGLWNLAVYRDNKLMGYVEIGLKKIVDLGKKLQELG